MEKTISMVLVVALCMVGKVVKADFTFGTPTNLGPTVNSPSNELYTSISSDGLSLYFNSNRPEGYGKVDIWVATRETTDEDWGTPVNLGPTINSPASEAGVSISSDGLSLYFSSNRPSGYGDGDLWVTTRETIHSEWGNPMNLGTTVNSWADQCYPSISADELALYFSSNRGGGVGGYDIWVTKRATIHDPWGTPENLGPTVNSSFAEAQTGISSDGRMLFFVCDRSGGIDIWVTSRATTDDPWGQPVNLGPTINTSGWEEYPNVSADGSTLYFRYSQSGRWGNDGDIWQAPIIPIVDLNGDEIVDEQDMCVMVDYWGTDDPLCDVGPMPWGDGIVDVEDLKVLAEHLFEEILPAGLIAYWKLDETEGDIAYDSAAVNDAVVFGSALWQPTGGKVDGALELDGINDYAGTPYILSPTDGDFSVFAWIKGGVAGQVILSQEGGANWLMTDSVDGALKTDLKQPGIPNRNPIPPGPPLTSSIIVINGDWHRVGFVRNGSERILYVDDVEVVRDTATYLTAAAGGLRIGAGSGLELGTFWSGLIDDVRIYNRPVSP